MLAVPAAALVERGQMQFVFVADRDVARARIVTVGERSGEQIEILSGISVVEQLRVISPVPAGLADGARIEVKP